MTGLPGRSAIRRAERQLAAGAQDAAALKTASVSRASLPGGADARFSRLLSYVRTEPQAGALAPDRRAARITPLASGAGSMPGALGAVTGLRSRRLRKIALFAISLFLFVLAILLMKEGARALAPLLETRFVLDGVLDGLGFGWLFSYVVLSGSPVAAAALAFLDAGVIDSLGAFAMITGSRLGAGFIVLVLGFVHLARGRDRETCLGMGLLSLVVTGTTYFAAMFIGVALLRSGAVDWCQPRSGPAVGSAVDALYGPLLRVLVDSLPGWALFPVGLVVIFASLSLFDRCLPQMAIRESRVGLVSRLVYRRWVMFALGAGITLVSMSVSLSLSILVPLSNRGHVRRENVIPYIMGANITTFVDTLLAAVLIGNAAGFTVVLTEVVSVAMVSAAILALSYDRYERALLASVSRITASNRNVAFFLILIFVVPVALLVL